MWDQDGDGQEAKEDGAKERQPEGQKSRMQSEPATEGAKAQGEAVVEGGETAADAIRVEPVVMNPIWAVDGGERREVEPEKARRARGPVQIETGQAEPVGQKRRSTGSAEGKARAGGKPTKGGV